MIADPDKSGGLGSIAADIRGILTGALNQVAAPALGKLLNIGELGTVDADGVYRPKAAPSKPVTAGDVLSDALRNPFVIAAAVAALVAVVIAIAKD
jgi:hypothetical protein